jgi:hypothetical protein
MDSPVGFEVPQTDRQTVNFWAHALGMHLTDRLALGFEVPFASGSTGDLGAVHR